MNKISNLGLIKKLINISTLCSLLFLVAISCVSTVNAYVLQSFKWPQPSTTFYVDIPGADGLWDDAFEGAMYEWGAATAFQFYIVRGEYSDPCNSSDDRNGVKFSSTDCGDAWGGTTLAITTSWAVNNTTTETDIVFNSNESWDVYYTSWKDSVNDFHRVAVHELGHALGLGHEDSESLTIMGTWAGDITTPQQDDINGVEAMYGLACCLYYRDSDNDGYGDPDSPYEATTQLSGFVVDDNDCVDYDPSIHPGATEICGDSIDQDCNGSDTTCEVDPDLAYEIQKLYIGYLGRAADKAGLNYWVNGIANGVITMEQLRTNLTNDQPEYTDIYGGLTRSQLASQIYRNLFDREPDAAGLEYWVNGGGSIVNADQLIVAYLNAVSGADQLVLDNKTTEAMYFTDNS